MNKYESSGLEAKHQHKYASNVQKNQKVNREKGSYNPLYPESDSAVSDKEMDAQQELNKKQNDD